MGVSFVVFVVIMFVFVWSRSSLRGRLVCRFRGRHVCLHVVAESNGSFIVLVVVAFVFAWSRSQMDVVSRLPKPVLVLLDGGAV